MLVHAEKEGARPSSRLEQPCDFHETAPRTVLAHGVDLIGQRKCLLRFHVDGKHHTRVRCRGRPSDEEDTGDEGPREKSARPSHHGIQRGKRPSPTSSVRFKLHDDWTLCLNTERYRMHCSSWENTRSHRPRAIDL